MNLTEEIEHLRRRGETIGVIHGCVRGLLHNPKNGKYQSAVDIIFNHYPNHLRAALDPTAGLRTSEEQPGIESSDPYQQRRPPTPRAHIEQLTQLLETQPTIAVIERPEYFTTEYVTFDYWNQNPRIQSQGSTALFITTRPERLPPSLQEAPHISIERPDARERRWLLQRHNHTNEGLIEASRGLTYNQLLKAAQQAKLTPQELEAWHQPNPWTALRKNDIEAIERRLQSAILGQDPEIIDHYINAIKRASTGLNDPSKPIFTALQVGPTGTGKTEIAKEVSRTIFGERPITIDLSECSAPGSTTRLTGAPPGYVGHDTGSPLATQLKARGGRAVVLFDEIEKADRSVQDTLMQVLDEARLTTGQGDEIDFRHCIVIINTNAGLQHSHASLSPQAQGRAIQEGLRQHFKPEFIARLQALLKFKPLSQEVYEAIAEKLLEAPKARLQTRQGIKLTYENTREIAQYIAGNANEGQGARPLKSAISHHIERPLCDHLLENPKKKHLKLRVENDEVKIR